MVWTQAEIDYLRENSQVFDSSNLSMILNHLDQAVISGRVTRGVANKMAFFSAMVIDKDSLVIVVENRGSSRSSRRADAGQMIMRVHYGIKSNGLKPSGDDTMPIIHIPKRDISPTESLEIFEFVYFKGTLKPDSLEKLMLKPLLNYNLKNFGKLFEAEVKTAMSKVDWGNI